MKKLIRVLVKIIMVLIILVVGFLGFLTATEYRPDKIEVLKVKNNQTSLVEKNTNYKVMTFNMGYASLGKDEDFVLDGGKSGRPNSKTIVNDYLDGIKTILTEHTQDFYFIQEVDLKSRRSFYINQVKAISDLFENTHGYDFAYNYKANFVPFPVSITDHIGYVESGLMTLSNKAIDDASRHQFPGSFSWPLRIANLKRAMMVNYHEIDNSDKLLVMVNLHMSAYDGDGSLRKAEMAYLKTFMIEEEAKGNYVVIGGDFNQTFPSVKDLFKPIQDYYVAYPIEDDYLPAGFSFQIDELKPTCRLLNQPYDETDPNTQYYLIDGFIVSDNVSVVGVTNLDKGFLYSDHNPIVLEFKLN